MCFCEMCCAGRTHYESMKIAGHECHMRYGTSHVAYRPTICPMCDGWVLERVA